MIVSIDYETFYSSDYSLSKMSETDYILNPLFQIICCSIKLGAAPSRCYWGYEAVAAELAKINWEKTALLCQNTRFDGAILAWHFGYSPALYLDTMSMAKATTHAKIGRSSLKKLCEYLGLPPKGDEVIHAMGKRKEDFTNEEALAYMAYCDNDNERCTDIFHLFMRKFPKSELDIIDWNIRMFVEPKVKLNMTKLHEHDAWVKAESDAVMNQVAHIDKSIFSSTLKFKALLEEQGVEVPMKISPTTGDEIPALAKGDPQFKELRDDQTQTPYVQALLAARVNAKSTMESTRTATLLNLSLRKWPDGDTGWMPIPLRYFGAHTNRFSGDGGFNFQNLKRIAFIKGVLQPTLKSAIEAPAGYRILHRDASQIEARMVAFLSGCSKLIHAFANGEDVYSIFATSVYGYVVTKALVGERFVGKTSILGLGYGMGPPRFQRTLFIGNGGMSMEITEEEARRIVALYRREYKEIPDLWSGAGYMLHNMVHEGKPFDGRRPNRMNNVPISIPAVEPTRDGIFLPNGLPIAYPNLRIEDRQKPDGRVEKQFVYDAPYGGVKGLFGPKVIENVSQGLSRIVITDIVRRVKAETKELPLLTTHDSLDYLVPEREVEQWDEYLDTQFAIRPSWAPELPLASEGGWGRTLADAEAKANN